jgi:hypothetical protein
MLLEPRTELLVQLRPQLLRHSVVGRVANQLMPETEGVVAREDGRAVRSDQFLPHERRQRAAFAPEFDEGCPPELLADHRPALRGHALAGRKLFEPSCEQRLDRGRDGDLLGVPVLRNQREHLLDEQRVAFGGGRDAVAHQLR